MCKGAERVRILEKPGQTAAEVIFGHRAVALWKIADASIESSKNSSGGLGIILRTKGSVV